MKKATYRKKLARAVRQLNMLEHKKKKKKKSKKSQDDQYFYGGA